MHHKTYLNRSTRSSGKLRIEDWASALTQDFSRTYGVVVYLVGCTDGLLDHVSRMAKVGFSQQRQFIVERDFYTYEALKHAAKDASLNVTIIHGDFLDVCNRLKSIGFKFDLLDFDGVENMGLSEFFYCEDLLNLNPEALHITMALRGKSINNLMKHLGAQKNTTKMVWDNILKKSVWKRNQFPRTKDFMLGAMRKFWKTITDYAVAAKAYRGLGRTPMIMYILKKQRPES